MSNFKFNGVSLSQIVITDTSPDGSYYTNFKYITSSTAPANSRPLSLPYQINNTSISNITLAYYTLYTNTATSLTYPTGATHFRVVARGGGGGGGGGSGASVNNFATPNVRYGLSGSGGTDGSIQVREKTAINNSTFSVTIGARGNDGAGKNGSVGDDGDEASATGDPGGDGGYSEFSGSGVTVRANGGGGGGGGLGRLTKDGGDLIHTEKNDGDIERVAVGGSSNWDNNQILNYGFGGKGGNGGNANIRDGGNYNANEGQAGSGSTSGALQIIWLYEE